MKRFCLITLVFVLWIQNGNLCAFDLPGITHYSLHLHIFPREERFEAKAQLTITNVSQQNYSEIPFLLYRLLEVKSIHDPNGSLLNFTQTITKFVDEGNFQVNVIKVQLGRPLPPDSAITITMQYHGSIYGYPEVMAYVKDKISESFSLIRPDALSYPMLSLPSWESLQHAYDTKFSYDLHVIVPTGYVVACGGLLKNTQAEQDSAIFIYQSKIPTWRMDIAVAKFKKLGDDKNKLFVYFLPEDELGAITVLRVMQRAITFYSRYFGEVRNYQGYTAIEIPDGWGSQASDYYFLQTAAAFKDTQRVAEVYHEIAHTWNAKAKPEVQRCRWFDEAFASYFKSLAIREVNGETAFQTDMTKSREIFTQWVNHDKKNYDTPIAEYGKEELGRNSYTKGAWLLYILHQLVGEEPFKQIIRRFLSEFAARPADFKDFQAMAERISKRNLKKFFKEWFYSAESSKLLVEKVAVHEILKRYQ